MYKQKGNAAVAALAIIVTLIVVVLVSFVGSYVHFANEGNRFETGIKATWENNQNILGQYTLKVQEMAQVPSMYKDDLKEVMAGVMTARMGADGSKAVVQWFKEQNIPFDSSMYGRLQQTIEAGRNEFQTAQTRLIDQKQAYNIELGNVVSGFMLHLAGYPKIDLDKYKPVVAGDTKQAFETGVQAPTKLR